MLEKDLAREFGEVFSSWPCYHVVSKSDPGWPDRMLVLPMSRVCYVELKIVSITLDDTFIIELRPDQAAWLAKWQRIGGLCFVMCMSGNDLMKGKYLILQYPHWKLWLEVPKARYNFRSPIRVFDTRQKLLEWFQVFVAY
jgi:hypothetical protein